MSFFTASSYYEDQTDAEMPGLTGFEASFIRLLDKLTNGTHVEINEIGTSLFFRPGLVVGGRVEHDCGSDQPGARSAGWFLEGILPLASFGKKPLHLVLGNCVTNDDLDLSVDALKEVSLNVLRKFGVGADSETSGLLEVSVKRRGARPKGGGLVEFKCPSVRELKPVDWTDPGLVRRVRGVAYSTKVSPQVANRCVHAARGTLNNLLPDVYIFTDVYSGKTSGDSPGFALLLTGESTTGCTYGGEAAAASSQGGGGNGGHGAAAGFEAGDQEEKEAGGGGAVLPENVASNACANLLEEVAEGGCVDSTHQPLALTLMAMGPEDVGRLRTGPLSSPSIATLRLLRDFLGVTFKVKTAGAAGVEGGLETSGTVLLSCLGSGYKNVARQVT
eukprot:CAMPEP_0171952898 /NCGR_PEP_ID=MMETSP0993-20121228/93684_1 /TAXON_ID=483369 /ORGANISM="non described non described, Strain CCMP2098" /LENGTH=388 /DNA_ID=CAMNT_0012598465 /DNA_START=111 /DNA_END=1278 /DNA_ORIENTATION=-